MSKFPEFTISSSAWLSLSNKLVTSVDMSSFDRVATKLLFSVMAWLLGKMAAHVRFSIFTRRSFSFSKKRAFHTFGIRDVLLKRLRNMSIEKPTAIQEKVSFGTYAGQCGQAITKYDKYRLRTTDKRAGCQT